MKYTIAELVDLFNQTAAHINGRWVPARPKVASLKSRIMFAWLVIKGKADIVTWPEGQ